MRRALLAAAGLLPVGIACAAGPTIVDQVHRSFSVRDVHVRRGSVVQFKNSDEFIHHLYVENPAMKFNSGEQPPGREVDITFNTAGTFEVRCEIHPRMLLNVTVD